MKIPFDFDDCILNPQKYIDKPIFVDYGFYDRTGFIRSIFAHSISYVYFDPFYNKERLGRIVRTNFNRVSLLEEV
jgi:hypothetical protein